MKRASSQENVDWCVIDRNGVGKGYIKKKCIFAVHFIRLNTSESIKTHIPLD